MTCFLRKEQNRGDELALSRTACKIWIKWQTKIKKAGTLSSSMTEAWIKCSKQTERVTDSIKFVNEYFEGMKTGKSKSNKLKKICENFK